MFEGDKFPRGGDFPGNLARGGQILGGGGTYFL